MAKRSHGKTHSTEKQRRVTASALGKGFFIALAVCLIGVGGMAVSTVSQTRELAGSDDTVYTTLPPTTAPTSAAPVAGVTAADSNDAVTTTVTTTTSAPSALFVLPLTNRVVVPFSQTPVYNETMEDYQAHLGVDFGGEEGQAVRALADGVVLAYEQDALWGGSLSVEHGGGIHSVYRGIDANVEVGDEVKVGEEIGFVQTAPCEKHSGAHLHVELYRDGNAVDPTTLLSGQLTSVND